MMRVGVAFAATFAFAVTFASGQVSGSVCQVSKSTCSAGSSCELTCPNGQGYSLSVNQLSCALGVFKTGARTCSPDPCQVTGLSQPQNGAINSECANGATLASGSVCALTCTDGYMISGDQPSCTTGTFNSGSI